MTRAKERLFLTSTAYRMLYGRGDYARESQFLRELDSSLLDETGDKVFVPSRKKESSFGVSTGSIDGFSGRPYKPYDPLQKAKSAAKSNAASGETNLQSGDRVAHGKFGEGLVVEADDKTVTIIFDSVGRKKLARGFAPIKKI
jgi:DNA helicase-2/ATP-dependent DNA helicase PcrA